jgi:glutamate-ammonia-ligase adenylyltransferase
LLRLLGERGHLPQAAVDELLAGYAFLRRFENRLQMLQDRQTHQVPTDPLDQARMALAMGHADWAACRHDLADWRARVHGHFSDLLGAPDTAAPDHPLWPDRLEQAGAADELRALGMDDPEQALSHLRALRDGRACRVASATARQRLTALLPGLLRAAATTERPTLTLGRLCTLLDAVATRSVYLAMLLEHPPAQDHLARLMAASAWIADWITRHPVVLDELLDARTLYRPLDTAQIERELDRALAGVGADDLETAMNVLRDHRYAAALHVAAAEIGDLLQPDQAPKALTALAEALLRRALTLARTPLELRHGLPRQADDGAQEAPLLVLGYGRLGSGELNYESDLDLVFLHDGSGGESDGAASLANETWFARVVQRLTHVLTTLTPAGRLYEIDVRLRPSGNAGPLVTSLSGFETYQREEAWTWEHQALVRARPVAGDDGLAQRFEAVRRQVLCQPRDAARLRRDVADMRRRIRDGKGLPAQGFELKLSPGGRVDVEFIAQYLVLAHAHAKPVLTEPRGTADILSLAGELGLLATDTAAALGEAFVALCALERRQTLDGAGTVVDPQRVAPQQAAIGAAWRSLIEG